MSIEALNFALNLPIDTLKDPGARHVLLILASYADDNGFCYPSRQTLANKTGRTTRSITTQLNALVEAGILSRSARRFGPRQTSNLYKIVMTPTVESQGENFAPWEFSEGKKRQSQGEKNDKVRVKNFHTESFKEESFKEESFKPLSTSSTSPVEPVKKRSKKEINQDRINDAELVFDYWRITTEKRLAKFTVERRRNVINRLTPKDDGTDGYSVDDIFQAIDGCKLSPHHAGDNDRGIVYDDLELICRTGTHLENFMRFAAKPAKPKPRNINGETFHKPGFVPDPDYTPGADYDQIAEACRFCGKQFCLNSHRDLIDAELSGAAAPILETAAV